MLMYRQNPYEIFIINLDDIPFPLIITIKVTHMPRNVIHICISQISISELNVMATFYPITVFLRKTVYRVLIICIKL